MAQQTAVEWLQDNCFETYLDGKIYCNGKEITYEIQQAKAMEKERIVNAWDDGSETEYQYHVNGEFRKCSHDYYNETFNK
mgnify:CR=1 FL=1